MENIQIKDKIATPLLTLNSNVDRNWFHCSQRDCSQKEGSFSVKKSLDAGK